MPIEIIVPRLGWSMEEGAFVAWLKQDGEFIRAGEALFSIEGDKAVQEIEAIDSGILRISPTCPKPGATVRVGDLLGHLLAENEVLPGESDPGRPPVSSSATAKAAVANAPAGPATPAGPPPLASPATRPSMISPRALRTATELGVEWSKLKGTGRTGRIRERDVLAAASGTPRASASASARPPVPHGKVVITDWTFPDLDVEEKILGPAGHEIVARQCRTEAELIALCREADVVITQFARVNGQVIAAMSKARAIVRYGIGVDNVDLAAARARGIPVCNVPDYCIDEVADQTLAFLLALTRQIVAHDTHVHHGRTGLATPLAGFQRVLVFDPVVPAASVTAAGAAAATLPELFAASDVLTLHCPSTPQTRKMVSAESLAQLKRGALFINVARGDLVDTPALVAALQSGQLSGAALDVCDPEPIPADHPLLKMPNVVLSPHIASCSVKAVTQLRQTVARLAAAALRGDALWNVVRA